MAEADYNVDQANYQGAGRYRHYKGGEYHVLGLALQENTVVKPGEDPIADAYVEGFGQEIRKEVAFVIYAPASPGSLLEKRSEDFWARELGDFNAQVQVMHNGFVPRFVKIT